MMQLQNHKCFYCTRTLTNAPFCKDTAKLGYTRDHFFPRSWGYTLSGNTVLSCDKCNRRKGSTLPTREEISRFIKLWEGIKGGPLIDLSEYLVYQKVIDILHKLVGPPVDRKNII